MRRFAFSISGACLFVLRPLLAQTPEITRRLDYHVADGLTHCPPEERLRQEVALRTGYDLFRGDAKEEVEVSIARCREELVATIEYRDAAGKVKSTRVFTAPDTSCSCWALVTSVGVAIAFRLTPFKLPEPLPCLRAPPPPSLAPSFQIGAGGFVNMLLALEPTRGGLAFVRLRWPAISVALESRLLEPFVVHGELGSRLDVGLSAGALVPCAHEGIFSGCALVELGSLRLTSDDPGTRDRERLVFRVGVRQGLEIPLGERVRALAHVEVLGLVTPTQIPIDRRGVWSTAMFSGSLGAGLALSF